LRRLPTAVLAAVLCSPLTQAEEYQLEPVVVTATRLPEFEEESLASVVVIPEQDIQRSQATDVVDLLRFHAGVEIGRNGGPGQPASIFLRGANSDQTLVLVDGVRINPGTVGNAPLQDVLPSLVQRIEVVKGPYSTLYGSDAIGGVIQIMTHPEEEGTTLAASAQGGSFDTRQISTAAYQRSGDTRAGLAVSYLDTNGFPTRVGSNIDSGYHNLSLNLYGGKRLGPLDVELSHWEAQGQAQYLDFLLNPLEQDFRDAVTSLRLTGNPTGAWTSTLRASYLNEEIRQKQSDDFSRTQRGVFDWQNDLNLGERQVLTAGLYASLEQTASRIFGTGFSADSNELAAFLLDDFQAGPHRVIAAARYNDAQGFGNHVTWNLSYGCQVTPDTLLRAASGTAFRAPDTTDLFGFGGNPNLDAETSVSLEAGIRHAFGTAHSASLTLFDNRIRNLIVFTTSSAFPDGRLENVGHALIRGLELAYQWNSGPWRAQLAGVLQNPEDQNTGDLLPRRARQSFSASVVYQRGRYQVGADFLATGQRKDSNFTDAVDGGYGLVNLSLQISLAPHWTLQAKVENLFDKDYALAAGYNTPGRSFYAGLSYHP
jgi:vitamin B12 transporter